ncbi:MAG: hypothetical protein K2X03_28990 [Bryobacteraceae bacterium]|nr:hypothetical protein [Bryobacteraceae bacterium]
MRLTLFLLSANLAYGQYHVSHDALDRNLSAWQTQGLSVPDDQLLSRANTLGNSFRGFIPYIGNFSPRDFQANRDLARRGLTWLAQVEPRGYRNLALGRGFAGAYGALGDYQSRPQFRPYGGTPGAAFGYAGAGRLSRRMFLGGLGSERDIERYALQLATLGGGFGYGFGMFPRPRAPQGLDAVDFGPLEDNGKQPLAIPNLDTAKLSAEQKAAWSELRLEFGAIASRVFQTQQSLDALGQRLRPQGMDLNAQDRATAYQMDGFLQDSASLIQAGDFAQAKVALDRASYLCRKLKSVAGGG